MPIYEYECTKCGHLAEVWQKISDPPVTRCHLCRGKTRKLISQSTFHLKGTGWYVTDYASKHGQSTDRSADKKEKPEKPSGTKEAKGSSKKPEKKGSSTKKSKES